MKKQPKKDSESGDMELEMRTLLNDLDSHCSLMDQHHRDKFQGQLLLRARDFLRRLKKVCTDNEPHSKR